MMIIRQVADMTIFAETSKAVRELAVKSFEEMEIFPLEGDYTPFLSVPTSAHWRTAPWVASWAGEWTMLKRLHIDSKMLPVPYLGNGFRGVRKLEVTNVLPQALRVMLECMPSVDWLSLLDRAHHPGNYYSPDELVLLCEAVRSVKPALRHLTIDEENLEENFAEALSPIWGLAELRTLVLRLGGETYVKPALLTGWSKLKYVHIDANLDDSGLRTLVDNNPELETLSVVGLDFMVNDRPVTLHGLNPTVTLHGFPSAGVHSSSLTALSLVNCMGIRPEALIALAGVHPLRKLAIAFLDFKETEVLFRMADLLKFAAGCPLLEELQLGEFVISATPAEGEEEEEEPATVTLELEDLLVLEQACPSLRRFIIPPNAWIGAPGRLDWSVNEEYITAMENLIRSEQGVASLPRLNSLMERGQWKSSEPDPEDRFGGNDQTRVYQEEEVEWGDLAAKKAFASTEVL